MNMITQTEIVSGLRKLGIESGMETAVSDMFSVNSANR